MKTSLRHLTSGGVRLALAVAMLAVVILAWMGRGGIRGRLLSLSGPPAASSPETPQTPETTSNAVRTHSPPFDGEAADPPQADAILLAARDRLTYGPSVAAKLHQRIRHLGGEVLGVGTYWQESFDRGGRFKLELRTKSNHLRVVGDGATIWRQATIGEQHHNTRIDLHQLARLSGAPLQRTRSPLAARPVDRRSVAPLTVGGVPQLLSSLAKAYRFQTAKAAVLLDVPVYELHGVLDANSLPADEARPDSPAAEGVRAAHVPVDPPLQIPTHVTVSLAQDDLFPYRVVYEWQAAGREAHERGVPMRVEIQFFEVSLGGEIDTRHFDYAPPREFGWEDITEEVAFEATP